MSMVLIGADHRHVTLDRLSELKGAHRLGPEVARIPGIKGVFLLATCNRFEMYLDAAQDADLDEALALVGSDMVRVRREPEAATHLVRVTCGLESALVGEREIRGQVRRAADFAASQGTMSAPLHRLVDTALRAAARVENETRLFRTGRTAIELALEKVGARPRDGGHAVVVGTGSYAGVSVAVLRQLGFANISVHSSSGRAEAFAASHRVTPLGLRDVAAAFAKADVVVTARGAGAPSICLDLLRSMPKLRGGRELPILDMALQRDVCIRVTLVHGIKLLHLSEIEPGAADKAAAAAAEAIALEAAEDYRRRERVRELDDLCLAIRDMASQAAERELGRLPSGPVPPEKVAAAMRRLAASIAHVPLAQARAAGMNGEGDSFRQAARYVLGIGERHEV